AGAARESWCNRSTPIIFSTERHDDPVLPEVFAAGSSFFLEKPVDQRKILKLLDAVKGCILDNRRSMRRVNVRANVLCETAVASHAGVSCDISERGIRIDGIHLLKPGDQSLVSFRLPTQSKPITANGQVVR